jgi:hypothetical protein
VRKKGTTMAVAQPSNQQHVPAWKRLGLKLKNSQPAGGISDSPTPKETTVDHLSKKRKASDIVGASRPSHDQSGTPYARSDSRHANPQFKERPLKRKKSVAFVDGTKHQDGDANEKLLEDYLAQQKGGKNQFSKSEIAHFTAPVKVHPANQPPTKVNGKTETAVNNDRRQNQKDLKRRAEANTQPLQDSAYISYLKEYRSARATWKFNKNHQKKLLDNLFNTYRLPTDLDDALSSYLLGLQGEAARKRLAESAEKIISETNGLEGAEEITGMPASFNIKEAKDKALKAQLKQTKSILRNQEAAETAYSDEHQEKLRKRKRAALVLQSLRAYPSPSSDASQDNVAIGSRTHEDIERPAKRKKVRRSMKMRTGVPDDDDTDETSSVSSVPSSTVSSSTSEEEDGSSDSDGSGSEAGSGSDASSIASSISAGDSSENDSDASQSESETE